MPRAVADGSFGDFCAGCARPAPPPCRCKGGYPESHVLRNPLSPSRWYVAVALRSAPGPMTHAWRPFVAADVRRFADSSLAPLAGHAP
ncbi:MAG: hypothetical protein LC659_05555 [Myxococcales bacterium]|nr:hypothetical protein [Myxococcales bacterium]